MDRLGGRSIFSLDDRDFLWDDVVCVAYLWDEMPVLERRIRDGLAAQRRLAEAGKSLSDDEIEDASNAWRYERNLISADDIESWLAARELTVDEWMDYVQRSESRTRVADRAKTTRTAPRTAKAVRPSSKEIDAVKYAEAVCSGTIRELIEKLAGRAAIDDRVTEEGRRQPAPTKAQLRALLDRLPKQQDAERTKRAAPLARMSLVYDRFVHALAAPAALDREIEAHLLEWTHLHGRALALSDAEPAREAALLIREDGLTIEKAAAVAKATVLDADYVLEEVDAPLKDRLVGAQPGDIVGPVETNDGFLVVRVTDRAEPSRGDPLIRKRARDRIVRRTVQAEIDKRITWYVRF